jgi:hypothetical protein
MENRYPPAPWTVRAEMHGAVLKMPPGSIPADVLPAGIDVLLRDGSAIVSAVWWDYRQGGTLVYREFLVAALRRDPRAGTVLQIWVDNEQSLLAGRELWYMPKELAEFRFDHGAGFSAAMRIDGRDVVSYRYAPRWTVPGRWPAKVVVVQEQDGTVRRTTGSYRCRFQTGRGELVIPADSEVAYLRRGRPVRHIAMLDVTGSFGAKSMDRPVAAVSHAGTGEKSR